MPTLTSMDGVECLAMVSKILFDTRLLELRRENEALKLKLFWKDHNPEHLKNLMAWANATTGGPSCDCFACAASGRHDSNLFDNPKNKKCTFKPWFEQVLQEHEMSIACGLPEVPVWLDGSVVDSGNNVLDDGRHFSNFFAQDWYHWTYGSKLWKATSCRDPELAKLQRLFRTLDTLGEVD